MGFNVFGELRVVRWGADASIWPEVVEVLVRESWFASLEICNLEGMVGVSAI